jgi:hypothetical protein
MGKARKTARRANVAKPIGERGGTGFAPGAYLVIRVARARPARRA